MSSESVEHPTGVHVGDVYSREDRQPGDEMQDMTSSAMESHPASPCVSRNIPSNVLNCTNEDYATVREANHDLPGSFDLILN
jgi:hypothetical protein